ncbi:hypothetical protein L596_001294 [Steinernema carpocapsae]|uniref:FAD-dependent oxidoreductase 2 FAD-binding domain-containing protein n=1 Tax=Steinernema carpocapsae TaxID=34508 RepID=A0A4U8UKL8_STECR|nr:hypothetical protein L596_001294 [Steinernema carpocapsae]
MPGWLISHFGRRFGSFSPQFAGLTASFVSCGHGFASLFAPFCACKGSPVEREAERRSLRVVAVRTSSSSSVAIRDHCKMPSLSEKMQVCVYLALMAVYVTAQGSPKMPKTEEPVLIVGGGLAGLSATIEALRNGAKVILIEREKDVGGNSAKASSGINGCGTEAQDRLGIKDSTDKFYSDTMSAGDRENDGALVDALVHESADAVQFLIDLGVDLSDINICGGHSVPRTHWIPSPKEGRPTPVGIAIIRALKAQILKEAEERPEFMKLMTNTEVLGMVTWNEYITGVRIKKEDGELDELRGKAVIMATGGFSADRHNTTSLLNEFAPEKMAFPTTNGAFARGDGIKMARAMGAHIIGMEHVQIHPTAFIDPKDPVAGTKFLAAEALRGKGALLVNSKGVRFANELGRRDYLTSRIQSEGDNVPENPKWKYVYMLMSDAMADSFGRPAFNFYSTVKDSLCNA